MLRAGRYPGAEALWRLPGTDGRFGRSFPEPFRQAIYPRSLALASALILRVYIPRRRSDVPIPRFTGER
jgi:hypothetical protein